MTPLEILLIITIVCLIIMLNTSDTKRTESIMENSELLNKLSDKTTNINLLKRKQNELKEKNSETEEEIRKKVIENTKQQQKYYEENLDEINNIIKEQNIYILKQALEIRQLKDKLNTLQQ